jgi:hypothetical protein
MSTSMLLILPGIEAIPDISSEVIPEGVSIFEKIERRVFSEGVA